MPDITFLLKRYLDYLEIKSKLELMANFRGL